MSGVSQLDGEQKGGAIDDVTLTADEAKRIRIALIFGDPAYANPPQPDPKLDAAKAKLKAIEAADTA